MRASATVFDVARPPHLFGASIFRESASGLVVAESQVYKEKFANQCLYGQKALSGSFYGYEGYGSGNPTFGEHNININWYEYTVPVYFVSPGTPRVKVWFVEEEGKETPEEKLRAAGAASNLQSYFEAVPLPNPAKVPLGVLASTGTDKSVAIVCPATGEAWEMHTFSYFKTTTGEGPQRGEPKFGFGGYYPNLTSASGIPGVPFGVGAGNHWGDSASGLGSLGGNISLQELIDVYRGGSIGHALGCSVVVNNNEHLAPAKADNGNRENTFEKHSDGTANPAFGAADQIPMGLWMRFPPASRASEYGMTGKLEAAMYEAMREYGVFVRDGSGLVSFYLSDPRTVGSPYCETNVNPFAGASQPAEGPGIGTYVNAHVSSAWTDPTLPEFDEILHGPGSVFEKMPWRTLEQLAPRES